MAIPDTPESLPLITSWTEVPFTDLTRHALAIGEVVTGIVGSAGFNAAEAAVCKTLIDGSALARSGGDPLRFEHVIARSPIADELHPPEVKGGIRSGEMLIGPFILDEMRNQRGARNASQHHEEIRQGRLREDTPGFSVIFMARLRSGKSAIDGMPVWRAASYCARQNGNTTRGFLWRTLGPLISGDKVAEELSKRLMISAEVARDLAQLGLAHAFSLPRPMPEQEVE